MSDFLKLLDPYRWLIGGVLIASAVGAFTWYRYSLIQEGHEKAIAEVQAEALKQIERAKLQTENMQEVKDEAIENAAIRAQKNADAAAAARSELERLRKSVANNPSVPGDTCTAAVDRAAALGAVFGECSAALAGMAEKADAHASDSVTLYESWPALDDFNDRLTNFTNSLKGTK